jgi:hypothetical protein
MIVIIGLCKKEVYPIFYPSPIAFHQMLEYQKRNKKIVAPTHPNRNSYTENQ